MQKTRGLQYPSRPPFFKGPDLSGFGKEGQGRFCGNVSEEGIPICLQQE